jgi:16S rRNA processing protein RimM
MGEIVGLFGVRGWVKVRSYTRPMEGILTHRQWQVRLHDEWRGVELAEGRIHGKGLVARLRGYDDRDQAAVLVGSQVGVWASELPPLAPGEYYWAQLEGLCVVNLADEELGVVSHLFDTGSNDVLVVKQGRRERLIPYTRNAIRGVDLVKREIRVDWDKEF